MLEAATVWSSWSISSPFSKCSGWKASILSVCCWTQSQWRSWILFSHRKASELIVLRHQDSPGSWLVFSRAAGVLFGKGYKRHHLHFAFFCTVWILVKLSVYRHFPSELEKLKILEYIHWNIAESLSIEWRTQQTWRTMKISSKEVTSTHTDWGPSISPLL